MLIARGEKDVTSIHMVSFTESKGIKFADDSSVYNDYEHFTFSHALVCASCILPLSFRAIESIGSHLSLQKPYLEFPIMSGDVYDGSSPGADRIVIGSIAEDYSSAVYCAVITHDGETRNGFAECADDTLNLRGKGEYKAGGKERKLLQKIEMKSSGSGVLRLN